MIVRNVLRYNTGHSKRLTREGVHSKKGGHGSEQGGHDSEQGGVVPNKVGNKKRLSSDNLQNNFSGAGLLAIATISYKALAHFASTTFRRAGSESGSSGYGDDQDDNSLSHFLWYLR